MNRVLLVEDNLFCAYAITSLLQQYSIECDVATNGQFAVEKVQELYRSKGLSYALIITDLYMPVLNGLEATYAIRSFLEQNTD